MFKRFDNAGVAVADLNRTRAFYQGKLGLTWMPAGPGMASVMIGNVSLFIFQTENAHHGNEGRGANFPANPIGLDHLAFEATDFEKDVEELTARGIAWMTDTVGEPGEFRYRGFADPDGNCLYLIELDEAARQMREQFGMISI